MKLLNPELQKLEARVAPGIGIGGSIGIGIGIGVGNTNDSGGTSHGSSGGGTP